MTDYFYKAFEDKFRGTRESIKLRQAIYLPFIEPILEFYPNAEALDLGCGRGEWLELLTQSGFSALGVDTDEYMLAECATLGLKVHQSDAVSYLKNLEDESVVIISGFHIAEHLPFSQLQILVQESLRVLKPGGFLILETPNPENILVGSSLFYLDPTHQRPIPPDLLAFLPDHYGFNRVKVIRLQEPEEVKNSDAILSLFHIFSGVSEDYSIVAQKKATKNILKKTIKAFSNEIGFTLGQLVNRYENQMISHPLQEQLKFSNMRIEELVSEITELKMHLKNCDNRLQESQQLEKQLNDQLESLDNRLQESQQFEKQLNDQLENLDNRLQESQQVEKELKNQLNAITNSLSWRITQPLRLFRYCLWKTGIKLRLLRGIILRLILKIIPNKVKRLIKAILYGKSLKTYQIQESTQYLLSPRAADIFINLQKNVKERVN